MKPILKIQIDIGIIMLIGNLWDYRQQKLLAKKEGVITSLN